MTRSEDGTDWYRWRRPSRKRGPIRRRIVDNGNSVDRPHFRRSIHQWDTEIDCIPPSCLEKENKFNPIIILVCVCVCVLSDSARLLYAYTSSVSLSSSRVAQAD